MSLSVSCDCGKTYKVAESAAGKKLRCKECGVSIPIPKGRDAAKSPTADEDPEFPDVDLQKYDHEDEFGAPAPKARRRTANAKSSAGKADLNGVQQFLIYAVKNPWVAMSLFFLLVWAPLAYVFDVLLFVDVALMLLCFVGFCVGLLLALIGVTFRNPFQMLTALTLGVAVALVVPPQYAPTIGRLAGNGVKESGYKSSGDFDTGFGGSMAVYCAIVGVILLAHITFMLFFGKNAPRFQ